MSTQHAPDELAIIAVTGRDACARPALVSEPIDAASAAGLAQVFKALGDPVRLRLVSLIGARAGGEVCVCDLTSAFDLSQPTISHHLKVLHDAGLLDRDKRGVWAYYRIRPEALASIAALIGYTPATS
jgi:ArsR family transcriptional regulator